ncbi:hypothetical protein CDAR_563391 [Caerostris darwini]|uniref:Uncharacterized protein n=1 Tax=Caerostris darwini TaxID=1538125 RepID=A0AAV4X7E7_9ARAC|nr:hypothetical protein CDAR_563391 [Caerostris darwini]
MIVIKRVTKIKNLRNHSLKGPEARLAQSTSNHKDTSTSETAISSLVKLPGRLCKTCGLPMSRNSSSNWSKTFITANSLCHQILQNVIILTDIDKCISFLVKKEKGDSSRCETILFIIPVLVEYEIVLQVCILRHLTSNVIMPKESFLANAKDRPDRSSITVLSTYILF